jgi:hypothetical protein
MVLGKRNLGRPKEQQERDPAPCFAFACGRGDREGCLLLWDLAIAQGQATWLRSVLNSDSAQCKKGDVEACRVHRQHLRQAAEKPVRDRALEALLRAAIEPVLRSDDPEREAIAATLGRAICALSTPQCLAATRSLLTATAAPHPAARLAAAEELFGRACGRLGMLYGHDADSGRSGLQRGHCADTVLRLVDALGSGADAALAPLWKLACDQGSALACAKHGSWLWRDTPRDPEGWRALHHACLGAALPDLPAMTEAMAALGAGRAPASSALEFLPDGCKWLLAQAVWARHGNRFARQDLQQLFERQPWYQPPSRPTPLTAAERRLLDELQRSRRGSLLVDDLAQALRRGGIFVDAPRCFALRNEDGVRAWTEAGGTATLLCRSPVAYESSSPRLGVVDVQATARGGQLAVNVSRLSDWNTCLLVPGAILLPTPRPRAQSEASGESSFFRSMAERVRDSALEQTRKLREQANPPASGCCENISWSTDDFDGDSDPEWVVELRCGAAPCTPQGRREDSMLGAYHYQAWPADQAPDESYRYYCDLGFDDRLTCHLLGSYEAGPDCANAHLEPGSSTRAPDAGAALPPRSSTSLSSPTQSPDPAASTATPEPASSALEAGLPPATTPRR